MTSISDDTAFLLIWTGYTVLSLGIALVILFWAIRTGQFSGQSRARYLALYSGIPKVERSGGMDDVSS